MRKSRLLQSLQASQGSVAGGHDGTGLDMVFQFEHYRQLIALRHTDPVVTDGEFELLLAEHPVIWAFVRRGR